MLVSKAVVVGVDDGVNCCQSLWYRVVSAHGAREAPPHHLPIHTHICVCSFSLLLLLLLRHNKTRVQCEFKRQAGPKGVCMETYPRSSPHPETSLAESQHMPRPHQQSSTYAETVSCTSRLDFRQTSLLPPLRDLQRLLFPGRSPLLCKSCPFLRVPPATLPPLQLRQSSEIADLS